MIKNDTHTGPVSQRWKGYGVAALSVGYFILAVVGWQALDSLELAGLLALFGLGHIAVGAFIVHKANRGEVVGGFEDDRDGGR